MFAFMSAAVSLSPWRDLGARFSGDSGIGVGDRAGRGSEWRSRGGPEAFGSFPTMRFCDHHKTVKPKNGQKVVLATDFYFLHGFIYFFISALLWL